MRKHWIEVLWALCIPLYLWGASLPDQYALAHLGGQPPYSIRSALGAIGVTTLEALVLYAIIRPRTYRGSWLRAVGALGLFIPWLLVSAILVMNAPPVVLVHLLWVLVVVLVLLGLCCWVAVRAIAHAVAPGRRPPGSPDSLPRDGGAVRD